MNLENLLKKCKKDNEWSTGNDVLYSLCKEHPSHKNKKAVIAKIWLIGRSYAAAIERRKKNQNIDNDDFYISKVAPKIIKSGIDSWIQKSRNSSDARLHLVAHKELTRLFFKISSLEKRSLASKYLHFHLPEKFYIYDTRSVGSISKVLKELKIKKSFEKGWLVSADEKYAKFYFKCDLVRNEILKRHSFDLTCRQIDNLLIEIGNQELRRG